MMIALATVNRARSAARTFMTMTLFDHYCAKLHTGLALDGPTALALRDEITRAIDQTPGALAFHPFRRGVLSAARATLKAPLELADLASRGALRRLLAKRSEVIAIPNVVGQKLSDAQHALAAAGFSAKVNGGGASATDIVQAMDPGAGAPAKAGTQVTLTLQKATPTPGLGAGG